MGSSGIFYLPSVNDDDEDVDDDDDDDEGYDDNDDDDDDNQATIESFNGLLQNLVSDLGQ